MKKQINPNVKAHLIRSAFYVLLLLAVCVIPFALAQRNTPKRSAATKPNAAATKVAATKAQLMAARERAKAVPSSLVGKKQLAPHRPAGAPKSLGQRRTDVPQAPNLSPWSIVANYPFASESVSVSSDGTFAYAVGGFDPNIGPTNAFNQYDPIADSWTGLPNVPGAFYDAPSVYAPNTNRVYVFGGIDAGFNPSNVVQIYDVASGVWVANGAPMPGARYFASAAYFNGKIYVIAGFDSSFVETSTTWEYDPVADTWDTTRANTPIPLGGSGYSIVGQNIYLAGTWNGGLGSTVNYRYDIVADSWTQMADVPVAIYRPDAAAIGTDVYLVGGGNPFLSSNVKGQARKLASTRAPMTSYNSTYIYDTVADSWTTGPNTNVPHSFTGGTAIGTKLIVVTGFDGVSGDTNVVEAADTGGGGCTTCGDYTLTSGTSTFVSGVDDVGNHTDDGDTPITIPFSVNLYDQTFTAAEVGSNGHLTFGTANAGFGITCSPFGIAGTTYVEAPYWTDQRTDAVGVNCADFASGCGIFTTTTGVAPNRIFYVEWRTVYFGSDGTDGPSLNYEIAIHEDCNPPFEFIYNTINVASTGNDSELVVGVKKDDSNFNQFGCDPSGGGSPPVSSGQALTAGCVVGPPPSPTPTPSGTPSGCTINGSIDPSDPTQTDRLFRSGIPQTCPASTTCAVFGDPTPRHYDAYTFTNTTGAPQCVTVDTNTACTGTNFIFIGAYLGSFDPNNICTNWIGDSGGSPNPEQAFSFDVNDGDTFVLVVSEVTPEAGCPAYTMTITPQSICGGGVSPTPSPTCPPGNPAGGAGPWTAGTAYPTTIVRYGFAQTATHFYVFGGVDNGATTNAVNRMDLSTGNWESRAPMPFSGEAPTCALMESTSIVYCADGNASNSFAAYDIASDTWMPLAPDPFVTDHYGSASGAFNGQVFVVGGTSSFSNAVWVYDVAGNSWSLGTAAPVGPFLLAGYHQIGQFLYVVGGFDPSALNYNTTLRLDMSTGTWDTGPTFTPQLADFGLAYDPGTNKLYSLGGDLPNDGNFFNSTNQVNELDVSAWPGGTWNPSPPDLPMPNRQAAQAGFYGNGDIWCVGGINGATFQFLNEVWHRNNGGGVVCPSPTPTISPTPTATATATVPPITPTPTATATATATAPPVSPTPSATATATATTTPRPTPTPRPRPTPYPRPTP
jgi:N-acetylneuraminic acid mutarotase